MKPSSSDRAPPSTLGTLVYILWGPIGWGGQLTLVYVGHTVFCALGATPLVDVLIGLATAFAMASIAPIILAPTWPGALVRLHPQDADAGSLMVIARWLAVLASLAVLWTGATLLLVDACMFAR